MHSFVTVVVAIAFLPAACALTLSRTDRAARVLQAEGSAELLQLANEVRQPAEALDKVKEMISNMIVHHMTAASEDTDHNAFCNKEMIASKEKVSQLKMDLKKRTADQDLHTAQLDQLKDSIADLHEALAKAQKLKLKAANGAVAEAAAYKERVAEWDRMLLALRAKLRSDIESERKAASQDNEDLTLKKVKAENAEETRKYNFKKLDGDMEVEMARKTKQVEQKQRKVISMTHEVSLGDSDFKMAEEEMSAAKGYEKQIDSQCINRQDPVKERKQARERQISSLKEAYGVLSGNDIP